MESVEERALVQNKGLKRFTSCFRRKTFNDRLFHTVTMSSVLGLTMNEVAANVMLRMSTEFSELPVFVDDAIFVGMALLESMLSPLLCWLGAARRARTMLLWLLLAALSTVPMYFLGFAKVDWDNMDLCNAASVPSSSAALIYSRLAAMAVMGLASACARTAVLAHGIAALDDFNSQNTVKDLGIILGARVMVLTLARQGIVELVRSTLWLQATALLLPLLLNCALLLRCPAAPPLGDETLAARKEGSMGFFQSMSRVLRSGTAVTHAASAGLLWAAAWGFAEHNDALVAAKYVMAATTSQAANNANIIRMFVIIMMVVVVSYQLAASSARDFDQRRAVSRTLWLAGWALLALATMLLQRCNSPPLEGLDDAGLLYRQPSFSLDCGCSKGYNAMFPVCSLANKTSYFSACHAGCERRVDFHGTNMLAECRGDAGAAFEGACNGLSCAGPHSLHQIMYVALLTTIVSLMMHFMVVLRSVDARDKAAALGLVGAAVALLAFVAGHLLYRAISEWTCAFSEMGECRLPNWRFQYALGGATAGIILVSTAINIGSLIVMKRRSQ